MHLSLLILLPLFFSPLYSEEVFQAAYDWEKVQIGLDNAAILLGRGDRKILNDLMVINRRVKKLEIVHHHYHTCAKIPQHAAICEVKDKLLEHKIHQTLILAYETASLKWKTNGRQALRELNRLGVTLEEFRRSDLLPVRPVRCSFCGIVRAWEASPLLLRTYLKAESRHPLHLTVELVGKSLRRGGKWNYRFRPDSLSADEDE